MRRADQHARVRHLLHEGLARARGVLGIGAEAARPLGLGHLDHTVHEVAGEHGLARLGGQAHAGVPRRVAMGRLEAEMLVHLVGLVHEHRPARLHHRRHAVGEAARGVAAFLLLALPELELRAHHDVLGLREGGHPLAIDQARVPAHVVHVQMRAEHVVHLLRRHAGGAEIVEIGALTPVPGRHLVALLVIADAGVDDHRMLRGLHHVGLDARAHGFYIVVVDERACQARHSASG